MRRTETKVIAMIKVQRLLPGFSIPIVFIFVIIGVLFLNYSYVEAADTTWSGSGDGTNWSDADNWFPAAEPTTENDVLIDMKDILVECTQNFQAKSLTIGGRETSTLAINNFIFGAIAPDVGSDIAILNRRRGIFIFKGAGGTVTVKGQYRDSNESLALEPSFMFWFE